MSPPHSPTYHITEPHPTTHPNQSIGSGRGGAGNFVTANSTTTSGAAAHGPASRFGDVIPQTSTRGSSGRGGAGNVVHKTATGRNSHDLELEAEERRAEEHRQRMVGRGGAGNIV